jgi:hypothetical protein
MAFLREAVHGRRFANEMRARFRSSDAIHAQGKSMPHAAKPKAKTATIISTTVLLAGASARVLLHILSKVL